VTPISSTCSAGSLSWIDPPASAASVWASQAPARAARPRRPMTLGDRLAQLGIEQDPRPFGADHHFSDPSAVRARHRAAAANQRVAGDHRQVEEQLDRALGQLVVGTIQPSSVRLSAP
jgi:hypothetical protein